jgi:hypothetical protein
MISWQRSMSRTPFSRVRSQRGLPKTQGARYEVTGQSCDGRSVTVICRIVAGNWLRIVTVFELSDD